MGILCWFRSVSVDIGCGSALQHESKRNSKSACSCTYVERCWHDCWLSGVRRSASSCWCACSIWDSGRYHGGGNNHWEFCLAKMKNAKLLEKFQPWLFHE